MRVGEQSWREDGLSALEGLLHVHRSEEPVLHHIHWHLHERARDHLPQTQPLEPRDTLLYSSCTHLGLQGGQGDLLLLQPVPQEVVDLVVGSVRRDVVVGPGDTSRSGQVRSGQVSSAAPTP